MLNGSKGCFDSGLCFAFAKHNLPQNDKMTLYFELRLAARFEGGTTPFSGCSFSIGSERLCSGLSPAEENCGPASGTVNPCAVYMASSTVEPLFAAATANTPCGTPFVKAVAM